MRLAEVAADVRLARMSVSSTWVALVVLVVLSSPAPAQQRRALASDDPQAQVMGYYAATMLMTPVGLAGRGVAVGGELTFIPDLSDEERRVGFGGTKLEQTNLCPVLPRLRASYGFAANAFDVGFVPPVEVCGVQALLVSAGFTRRVTLSPAFALAFRAHALVGSLQAAITCPKEATQDTLDRTCHGGQVSEDEVKPLTVGFDAMLVHRGGHHPRLEMYALLGIRREQTGFDVNYTRLEPNPLNLPGLDDHERLESTLTRAHAAAGASYAVTARLRLGAEAYYAPGALFTVRGRAGLTLGRLP